MGTWGNRIYENDTAADLRETFREVAQLPVETDEVVRRLVEEAGVGDDPFDEDAVDFWLALADLLHRHGMAHAETETVARRIITEGIDLKVKRELEMSEADLKRRARVLDDLLDTWSTPHPKPRKIKKIPGPEPFLFEPGEVWAYPTMQGAALPFEWSGYNSKTIDTHFRPDGWGGLVVLERWRHKDFFARYLIALAMPDGPDQPTLADVAAAPIQGMEEPDYGLDDKGELTVGRRTNRMIFTAHVRKPKRALKLWRAVKLGMLAPDAKAARAAVTGPLAESFLWPDGLASLEHLLTVSSFHKMSDFAGDNEHVLVKPLGDLRISDIARIAEGPASS